MQAGMSVRCTARIIVVLLELPPAPGRRRRLGIFDVFEAKQLMQQYMSSD